MSDNPWILALSASKSCNTDSRISFLGPEPNTNNKRKHQAIWIMLYLEKIWENEIWYECRWLSMIVCVSVCVCDCPVAGSVAFRVTVSLLGSQHTMLSFSPPHIVPPLRGPATAALQAFGESPTVGFGWQAGGQIFHLATVCTPFIPWATGTSEQGALPLT